MLYSHVTAEAKRVAFRAALASGKLQRLPGAYNALTAKLIEDKGFEGVYISGGVLANDLGLPDIGLTTLTEVASRAASYARVTDLPSLVDADTGFGEAMNVARTVQELENAGLAGCHIEDQVNPKRCGHLDGKAVVDTATAVQRIRAAVEGRRDPNFVICARTDIRSVDGFDAAVDRAKALVAAGADMIFPEALVDLAEFDKFRSAIDVPILANMTEFGKSELFSNQQLGDVGVNIVIYPVSLQRAAIGAASRALDTINAEGSLASAVAHMQTRADLYETVDYAEYNAFDGGIFNFTLRANH